MSGGEGLELSIVIPCLNEEPTVGDVVAKAVATLGRLGIAGEVVVADRNIGITDGMHVSPTVVPAASPSPKP